MTMQGRGRLDVHARGRQCRCGQRYDARCWGALALVQTIPDAQLARFTVRWPEGVAVEVRRCAACGAAMAATVRSGPPAVSASTS